MLAELRATVDRDNLAINESLQLVVRFSGWPYPANLTSALLKRISILSPLVDNNSISDQW